MCVCRQHQYVTYIDTADFLRPISLTPSQLVESYYDVISTSFYANFERGNKSMSLLVLRNLADALQVSTDALLYECNPQCHMQSIYTILRNKSNSFIIAAEKMIRLLSENFE